ncbi:Uncharacterized protein dnm_092700 [Desulfonema magnum]|uniref:Uncharacterized protein n=1 Tax=Desulfonema magnum TaxID=45655 RepID=A0A975BWX0_9BACT|nr:Uncharacterized protein dnm_092700 [Desulfonema magnum]
MAETRSSSFFSVIPAKAGIHCLRIRKICEKRIPAFAGMTGILFDPGQKVDYRVKRHKLKTEE